MFLLRLTTIFFIHSNVRIYEDTMKKKILVILKAAVGCGAEILE